MGCDVVNAEGTVTKRASGPMTVIRAYGMPAAILDEACGIAGH